MTATQGIASAKFAVPATEAAFPRRHLFERLKHGGDSAVTWISAPAGSGKTTLAASYLARHDQCCLWYQLDAGDADPADFFYFLTLAAQTVSPRAAQLPRLAPELAPGLSAFARRFFRQLFALLPAPCVLVFDDYHELPDDAPIHALLTHCAQALPPSVHMMVLSRKDPPAPFARLILSRRIRELGWRELKFSREELPGLCRALALDEPDPDTLLWLEKETDGWAAGVILLARATPDSDALRQGLGPHNRQLVFDYFANELFDRAAAQTQQLLLRAALLPFMEPPMVAALAQDPDAAQNLLALSRGNNFIECLSGEPLRYRFHPLFRQFLLARGRRVYAPDHYLALSRRAATLLREASHPEPAMQLLLEVQDYRGARELLLDIAPAFSTAARFTRLASWIAALPEKMQAQDPWLIYWQGMIQMAYSPAEARAFFESAYEIFRAQDDTDGCFTALCGVLDAIAYGWDDIRDAPRIIETFGLTLDAIERPLSVAEQQRWVVPVIWVDLCFGLNDASPRCKQVFERAVETAHQLIATTAGSTRYPVLVTFVSWYHAHRGNWAAMREYFALGSALGSLDMDLPTALHLNYLNSYLRHHMGIPGEARRYYEKNRQLVEHSGAVTFHSLCYAQACYSHIEDNDTAALQKALNGFEQSVNSNRRIDLAHYHYLSAWLDIENDEPLQALQHSQQAIDLSLAVGAYWPWQLCALMHAAALTALGRYDESRALLQAVLEHSRRTGMRQPFLLCRLELSALEYRLENRAACLEQLRLMLEEGMAAGCAFIPMSHRAVLQPLFALAHTENLYPDYLAQLARAHGLPPPARAASVESAPWQLRIYTLGRFEVVSGGRRKTLNRQPARLLKALIALGGRNVSQEKLTDCLWPDADGDRANNSLKVNLHRLRSRLGKETILAQNGKLSLATDKVWVDALALQQLIADKERDGSRDTSAQIQALYGGEFMANEDEEHWLLPLREKLSRRAASDRQPAPVTSRR